MPHRLFVFRPTPIGRNDLFTPSKTPIFNSLLSTNTYAIIGLGILHFVRIPAYTIMGASCINTGTLFTGSTYTVTGLVVLYD